MGQKLMTLAAFFQRLAEMLGVSGKAAVGASTLVFLLLAIYATITNKDIPGGVVTCFVTIWGSYTVNRTHKDYSDRKLKETVHEPES